MSFARWLLMETPCTNVCLIDPVSGLCAGCRRTRDEIATWSSIGDARRRQLMIELAQRRSRDAMGGRP
jgi:uncharacterized protein